MTPSPDNLSLFATEDDTVVVETAPNSVARVAIERAIDKQLDYAVPKSLRSTIKVGQRVRVPLGRRNRLTSGYVVELSEHSQHGRLKPIHQIVDARSLVTPQLLQLAIWISRYYVAALGMVLENMIPSAVKKRIGGRTIRVVKTNVSNDALQKSFETMKAKKRRAIVARLLQLGEEESIELVKLASESGVKSPTVIALSKLGLVRIETKEVLDSPVDFQGQVLQEHAAPRPTEDQARAIETIGMKLEEGFSTHLLHGVTGSGKTEVYLKLIEQTVRAGRGAIVLVPEIALTPQTVKRFTERFGRVAVLHSGLAQGERHRQWQAIASGSADVVVGARSAIFAPHPKLGLIVVDEEHESSYKQETAPRYHARDVAIKRAQLEAIPVLLGSATPSLESWIKTDQSQGNQVTMQLHPLPCRVSNRPLPSVEIVDLREVNRRRKGVHLFSPRLEAALRHTLDRKKQAIILLNRRGYSNFIYCVSCQTALECSYCDKTLTYHRSLDVKPMGRTTSDASHAGQAHCHYCLAVNPLPTACPTCGKKLSLFGLGTQRVEEELKAKLPGAVFARVDSDTMRSARDYTALLTRFAAGEVQILLGTQMLAKGLDFPNVTLVGVISADTALSLPDFRAAERTFQLLTQVAGRAGRGNDPGQVIVQTFLPEDQTIRASISQDYIAFATRELEQRAKVGLPPFTRQVRIILRDEEPEKLFLRSEQMSIDLHELTARLSLPITLKGPMPAPVGRIAGYHRAQIVLVAARAMELQKLLGRMRVEKKLLSTDRVAIDVDPVSLL